jgi:hypothetical protein
MNSGILKYATAKLESHLDNAAIFGNMGLILGDLGG